MPIEIWDLLPEEVPCTYVGIVYSENLLLDQAKDYLWPERAGHATAGTPAHANSSMAQQALAVQELHDLQREHNDLKDIYEDLNGDKKILAEEKSRLELRCADLESQALEFSNANSELEMKCIDLESQLRATLEAKSRLDHECTDIKQQFRKMQEDKSRLESEPKLGTASKQTKKSTSKEPNASAIVDTFAAAAHRAQTTMKKGKKDNKKTGDKEKSGSKHGGTKKSSITSSTIRAALSQVDELPDDPFNAPYLEFFDTWFDRPDHSISTSSQSTPPTLRPTSGTSPLPPVSSQHILGLATLEPIGGKLEGSRKQPSPMLSTACRHDCRNCGKSFDDDEGIFGGDNDVDSGFFSLSSSIRPYGGVTVQIWQP